MDVKGRSCMLITSESLSVKTKRPPGQGPQPQWLDFGLPVIYKHSVTNRI